MGYHLHAQPVACRGAPGRLSQPHRYVVLSKYLGSDTVHRKVTCCVWSFPAVVAGAGEVGPVLECSLATS